MTKSKLIAAVLLAAVCTSAGWSATRPNIVYILADDLGIGDVRVYNKDAKFPMPSLQRMADEGMTFTDAHTADGVCTPSRYAILTGRYCWRSPSKAGVIKGFAGPLIKPTQETVASLLKKQGYATACVGKWHLGLGWHLKDKSAAAGDAADLFGPITGGPVDLGFDYFFGMSASFNLSPHLYIENRTISGELERVNSRDDLLKLHNIDGAGGWISKGFRQDRVLRDFTEKSCNWIRAHQDEPFFLYLPLNSPHYPLIPSPEFRGKSHFTLHGDFCMETDWAVGQVMDTLDELGISDNTLVIFTSDNGVAHKVGNQEMQNKGHFSSWIYRGCKGHVWEGGHHVPYFARWPRTIQAGSQCDQLIGTIDLMATLAELHNTTLSPAAGVDSISFLPALSGQPIPGNATRPLVHHSDRGTFALRRGNWKLVMDNGGPSGRINPKDKPLINQDKHQMLVDVKTDPRETINVASSHPEIVESMKRELGAIISNGRTTLGPKQTNEKPARGQWTQLDSLRDYLK